MLPRSIAGRYKPLSLLGTGGYGRVYLCWDRERRAKVALKQVIHPVGDTLFREYKTLRSLRHDNIVQVFDVGRHEGHLYITMEFIEGADIHAYGFSTYDELVRLVRQLLNALDYIHKRGILHRDIKPSNVLIAVMTSGLDQLKLVDFGLATRTPDSKEAGTYDFMAPEVLRQALFLPHDGTIDHRADLFSVGALLYFLITARFITGRTRPAKNAEDMVQLFHKGAIPSIDTHRADVPRSLVNIVARLLSIDRQLRPAAAFEVLDELRRDFSAADSHGANVAPVEDGDVFEYFDAGGARHEILSLAGSGKSSIVAVRAHGRHGKTRLIEDVGALLSADGFEVVTCAYVESGDLSRSPQVRIASRIANKRPDLQAQLAETYPLLYQAADAEPEDPARQLEDELAAVIQAELQVGPLAVLVDDAHYCDLSFGTFLRAAGRAQRESRKGNPLIVVVTVSQDADAARREHVDALLDRHATAGPFHLEPFAHDQIRTYLRNIADRWEGDLDELVARLELDAGGIPGHMEDLLRDLRHSAGIEVSGGVWRISSGKLADLARRDSRVAAGATDRLARLPLHASSVLQVLSVFHPRLVVAAEVQEVSELPDHEVESALEILVDSGYVRRIERQYSLRTATDRRTVYERIQPGNRAVFHRRIARLLETRYRGDLEARYPEIALHHALGDDPEAGRLHAVRAARMLAGRHQTAAAMPHYANAIRLHEELLAARPERDTTLALARLYLEQASAYVAVLEPQDAATRAEPAISKATRLAEEAGDPILRARCAAAAAELQVFLWKHVKGEDQAATTTWRLRLEGELRALEPVEGIEADEVRAEILEQLGWIYGREENHRESARVLRETLTLYKKLDRRTTNRILTRLATAQAKEADERERADAITTAEAAVDVARKESDDFGIADAHKALAHAYTVNARADLALAEYRKAADLSETPAVGVAKQAEILQHFGELLSELHHADEAIKVAQRILDRNPDGAGSLAARAHFVVGKGLYRLARYSKAREHLEHTLSYARGNPGKGRVPLDAQVEAYVGRMQIEMGQYEEGARTLRAAVDKVEVRGKGESLPHYFVADTLAFVGAGLTRRAWVRHLGGEDTTGDAAEIASIAAETTGVYSQSYLASDALIACARALQGAEGAFDLAREASARLGECAPQEAPITTFLIALAMLVAQQPREAEGALGTMRRTMAEIQHVDLEIGMEALTMIALARQGRLNPARRHKKRFGELLRGVLPHLPRPEDADEFMNEPFRKAAFAEAERIPKHGG